MRKILGILAILSTFSAKVRGQTLEEVLCSVQERKLAVVQRAQVEAELNNDTDPGQQLIVWAGLPGAVFPEAAQVDALGIGQRIALLSQAMTEFSKLTPCYLNLRSGDLAGGAKVGALRPFIQEDFPQFPRVEAGNFPVVLAAFARQVRQLRVLPWVASLRVRENSYYKHRWEILDNNVVTEAEGSDPIGWQPTTLGVGDLDEDDPKWVTASANISPSMESLMASGTHTITTHHDGPPDGKSDYELRNTTCSQTTSFISNAYMMAVPPGVAQTVTGKVALVAHVEYNSAAASSFDSLPDQWNPEDAGFHVLAVSAQGGGNVELPANGPGIKAKPAWSDLQQSWPDIRSSDGMVASSLPAGSLGSYVGLQRAFYPLFVPAFARGLDTANSGIPAALDHAAKAIRPPSGDGQVVLHPRPGLLVGVPLGVGFSGDNSTGWIGISPGYYDFMTPLFQPFDFFAYGVISPAYNSYGGYAISPIGIRFDYSANLRFVGAAEDFHVVYATSRGIGGRGVVFPEGYPSPDELADSGWEQQSVLTAWDLPRIRQIVGRDLVADVSTLGHYKTTVTIYRRPADAEAVDRTPGQPVSVENLLLVRTLVFDNPSNAGDSLFYAGPEKVRVTDGTQEYTVVRSALTADTGTITFTGPLQQKTVSLTTDTTTGGRGASVTSSLGGASLGSSVISGDTQWRWWGYRLPSGIAHTAAGGTRTHVITRDASAGCRDGHFPKTVGSTGGGEPAASFAWDDNGLPVSATVGPWSETTAVEDTSALKTTRKLNGSVWATSWIELLDGGRRTRTYSAPDGGSHSKGGTAVDWSEMEYGSAMVGLPGLPHIARSKSGIGATYAWTLNADDSGRLVTERGKLSGDSVAKGTSTTLDFNARGYPIEATTTDIDDSTLEFAGTTGIDFTDWGAPLSTRDHLTGLLTWWTHDNNLARLASVTSPLGLVTEYSAFDALDRPGKVKANGITAINTFAGLGGTTTYSGTDVQAGTQSSTTRDALGRLTASNTTWNGVPDNLGLSYGTGTVGISRELGPFGTHSAEVRQDDGSLSSASGPTLPFGGATGDPLSVSGGLLVSKTAVANQQGDFQETHTDAWGRVRKVVTPSNSGSGSAAASFGYSVPSSTFRRVITNEPSGRILITESDPFDASGAVSRSGIDVNGNGSLGATDRYTESVTTVASGKVVTTLKVTENTGLREILQTEWTPSTGTTVTKVNGNEETITQAVTYPTHPPLLHPTKTIITDSTKGWSNTKTFNNLGLSIGSTLSGPGIPTSGLDPVWRADGSLASVELTIGGESHNAAFNNDGTLSSLTVPGRGNILEEHTIASGIETLTVDGVTVERKLDDTQVTTSGADIIGKTDTLAVSGGGYQETVHPTVGADTTTDFNAAGVATGKSYAAGAGESYGYDGELLSSVSLARGGELDLGYSPDGAKDLISAVWPIMVSGTGPDAFTIPAVTHSFGHDRAGRVDEIGDTSGARIIGYDKGRLVSAAYLSGPLKGYEIIRHRDATGRDTGFTLYRDGAVIHSAVMTPDGNSDQLLSLASGNLKVKPQRDAAARITGFQWGDATGEFAAAVTQTWHRGVGGRIETAGSDVSGAPSFDYLIEPEDPEHPVVSFDARGRRLKCATAGGIWTYAYTNGQLTSAAHPTLGTFSYQFDGIGRRKNHEDSENFADLLNRTLDWKNSQTKTLRIRMAAGADVHIENGTLIEDLTNFSGDGSRSVPIPGDSGGWVPWRVRATLQGQGEGAGNPPPNALASPDAKSEQRGAVWVPPVIEQFHYDQAGNRESSAQWDYGWDGRNQLVRARTKGYNTAAQGWDLTFGYDSEGRRYRKHVIQFQNGNRISEREITFVWDGWNMIYERHQLPSGLTTLERKYLWGEDLGGGSHGDDGAGGAGGLLLIRETKGSQTQDIIPLYDGTGHVIALTNASKGLLASYAYGPFGELIHATGPLANSNPWRYATKYYDAETGHYYYGKRYYDPVTCQWTSRELLGESESLNLYQYTGGDPVNKVDRLGLQAVAVCSQQEVDELRSVWLLSQLADGVDNPIAPTSDQTNGLSETGRFGMRMPFAPADFQRAFELRKNVLAGLGGPSMRAAADGETGPQPAMSPTAQLPDVSVHALTTALGGPYSQEMAQFSAGLLLPVGAEGYLLKGALNGLRLGRLMMGGASLERAMLIRGVSSEMRAGELVANAHLLEARALTLSLASNDVGTISTVLAATPSSGAILLARSGQTTTILGRFDPDLAPIVKEVTGGLKSWDLGPKIGSFNVLNVPDAVYDLWGAETFWECFNRPWLDRAIMRGDQIVLATRPTQKTLYNAANQLTGFGREYKYLISNGFKYNSYTNIMSR